MHTSHVLARDQGAVLEFLTLSASLREIADDAEHGRGMLAFTDALLQSVASFGACELSARQAERCRVLELQPERAEIASRTSTRHNEAGIRTLGYAREALSRFREDLQRYPKGMPSAGRFEEFRERMREQLVELELKASDIAKISQSLDECIASVQGKEPLALADYLGSQVDRLERARRQKDRGTAENIPVWKAIAIAVFFGIALWGLFKCVFGFFGGCTLLEGAAYAVVGGIAAAIARFC